MTDPSFATFALQLAAAARAETMPRRTAKREAADKSDGGIFDPVTIADREAERVMRAMIEAHFPCHGIAGEEFGDKPGEGAFCWSLDPIDGTRSFICGLPTWVTLIGLVESGDPILGIIDAPCLGETYIGDGGGTRRETADGGADCRTSGCADLALAYLSTTDPYLFAGDERRAFDRLYGAVRTTRFGLDGYAYARLASGSIDLVVECGLKPHDYQALIPVVRGAGGTFGDWHGGTDFSSGNVIAAASRPLYDAAVRIMSERT